MLPFPIFAALYYWIPLFTSRMLNEQLGRWHFWLFFIGFHIAFFPMHIAGFLGMRDGCTPMKPGWAWISTI
ncbi:MAG: cbb3-type cytochrome c oxidase subunit I [Caldilineaceae bacterium]